MYAVRRPVENVYLVRERDRRRTIELVALVLAALPPLAVLFAAVWANLQTYQIGYQIGRLERQRESLEEKKRQLLVERALASSLVRVERIARGSLGLAPPRPEQLILVHDASKKEPKESTVPATAPAVRPLAAPPVSGSTEEGF